MFIALHVVLILSLVRIASNLILYYERYRNYELDKSIEEVKTIENKIEHNIPEEAPDKALDSNKMAKLDELFNELKKANDELKKEFNQYFKNLREGWLDETANLSMPKEIINIKENIIYGIISGSSIILLKIFQKIYQQDFFGILVGLRQTGIYQFLTGSFLPIITIFYYLLGVAVILLIYYGIRELENRVREREQKLVEIKKETKEIRERLSKLKE